MPVPEMEQALFFTKKFTAVVIVAITSYTSV
jgi:hypothetical protein